MEESFEELEYTILTMERMLKRNYKTTILVEYLLDDISRCKELLDDIKTFI